MIKVKDLIYKYRIYKGEQEKPEEKTALAGLDLQVDKGRFIGILGRNGSGKSTLAFHLAALLKPTSGLVLVKGMDTGHDEDLLKIRKTAGMVFQNPDNQLIGSTVEEDIAFGPENLGLSPEEIDRRIGAVLETTSLSAYRFTSPHNMSGGQKQKIAISGILAMEPECIIFDEPTAMTDPRSSREIGRVIRSLNKEKGITILYITHHIREMEDADQIFVMDKGRLEFSGRPEELFRDPASIKKWGLELPPWLELTGKLMEKGWKPSEEIRGEKDLVKAVKKDLTKIGKNDFTSKANEESTGPHVPLIKLQGVSYHYPEGSPGETINWALKGLDLEIGMGECIALIGAVGSGKSTLFHHLNGLLKPDKGKVFYEGQDVWESGYSRKELRKKVGLCFQDPGYQLFADTVLEDIAFGPRNMGAGPEEAKEAARKVMGLLAIGEEYEKLSPFMLSGGEQRRVALAGILAMEPDILVLDEPIAGLDETGRQMVFSLMRELLRSRPMTIIFSSHSMDDAANIASRILVMDQGRLVMDGRPEVIFSRQEELTDRGLDLPWVRTFCDQIGWENVSEDPEGKTLSAEELPVKIDSLTWWLSERMGLL